jgi:hypothetical protein
MTLLEKILSRYDEAEFLTADGFDDAIIGVNENSMQIVYSVSKSIDILMERDGMEYDEAIEFMEYNVINTHVGEIPPIWCNDLLNNQ